ncbi:Rrf2 family transcriptional regulator [Desulfuromonas carbonis]|uniref:RrF2 family transcriptional regulator n=1 Tax=Desulfuromonas sp. DDH964 TaxID=1823759 RepID=UPI00078D76D9|nr:Rrf2 family transcriptional regulator [Desulfuromonas sp. DDH964]AMV70529.1 Rrf2 family winged helix-turn-helix transcriptional regulator [Desulfuromonas sp. DDH964]
MISKKTKYGLQALLSLAREHGLGPLLIADLAEQERIPKKFLELILLQLKNAGILGSRKGKGGGYFLAKDPAQITLGSAIRVLEGPLAPIPCASETAYQKCEECHDENTCGIRLVMKDVRNAIADILDHTSLKDVLQRSDEASKRASKVIDFTI